MKTYIKPETIVVKIQQQSMLCQSEYVKGINGCDFELGGGAAIDARTREQSIWGEEW